MPKEKITINGEIDRLLVALNSLNPDDEKYETIVSNLKELCEARSKKADRLVSPDTIAIIIGGTVQILIIMYYEQLHILGSKALGWIIKGRL